MVFKPEEKERFIQLFYEKQSFIEAFEGCISVDLMVDKRNENALATWSIWQEESFLDQYRQSALFIQTWEEVKPMFSEKARAWSFEKHELYDAN